MYADSGDVAEPPRGRAWGVGRRCPPRGGTCVGAKAFGCSPTVLDESLPGRGRWPGVGRNTAPLTSSKARPASCPPGNGTGAAQAPAPALRISRPRGETRTLMWGTRCSSAERRAQDRGPHVSWEPRGAGGREGSASRLSPRGGSHAAPGPGLDHKLCPLSPAGQAGRQGAGRCGLCRAPSGGGGAGGRLPAVSS